MLTGNHVIVNSGLQWSPRIEFTIFHEIFHLMEEDGEIIEFYTQLLRSDDTAYKAAIERCCHQGAAEFMMPQARVREAISSEGFSVDIVESIADRHGASIVASALQLARCAPVDCFVVVCSHGWAPRSSPPHHGLFVEYAGASPRGKYTLARFSPIHSDNLLVEAWRTRSQVRGTSYVPFRSGTRMKCHCDASYLNGRVLGVLSLEDPVPPGQLAFRLD